MPRSNSPEDVFRYINTMGNDPDVCWPWIGYIGGRENDPRGTFKLDGRRQLAHRVVFEIFNGPIPEGKIVRHKCDNTICCNPTHLVLGTRSQNEDDKYDRDRAGYTHDMLKEMRRCHRMGMTYTRIAVYINDKFGTDVKANGIGKVLRGDRRKGHGEIYDPRNQRQASSSGEDEQEGILQDGERDT